MKLLSKPFLTIVFSILFFGGLTVCETPAQLQEMLNRMETHQKSLASLRTKVSMEKYNVQLKESDFTEGTAIYQRTFDNKLRGKIDWIKPVQETAALFDKKFIVYRPRIKQAYVGKFNDKDGSIAFLNQLSFLSMSKRELKAYYSISYIGGEKLKNGVETAHLILVPKNKSPYKSAELWVDRDGMPNQIKIVELGDDSTTFLCSDFSKNNVIKFSEIKVSLPKDIIIIKESGDACVCFKPDQVKEAFNDDADVVFSGKITAVNGKFYQFQTEKIWKGEVGKNVNVQSMENYFDCPLNPVKGNRYIVFANRINSKGVPILVLMPCNYTTDLSTENGTKILKEIGNGKPVKNARVVKSRKSRKK